jgi:CheY-like chemotaxis protein
MTEPTGGTVVLLDDNLLSSSGLVSGLKRLGYTPRLLSEANDAVARAAGAAPAVVLVNLAARAWDSDALVRALKDEAALAGVPVVGFCGHLEVDRIHAARSSGCDLVVANSAIASDLAGVLRQALRRGA